MTNYKKVVLAAAMMSAFGNVMTAGKDAEPGTVVEQQMLTQMFAQVGTNDLEAFKSYYEENEAAVASYINCIKYSYGVKPRIYSADEDKILQVNPASLFGDLTGSAAMSAYMDSDVFHEMIDNPQMIQSQYDVLKGRWPEAYNEMVFVLSDPSSITDYMAYALLLKDPAALEEMMKQVMQGKAAVLEDEPGQWTYEELMALTFRLVDVSSMYRYNEEYGVWENMSSDDDYMRQLIANGEELKIVGIVCPREGANATLLSPGIAYTNALTRHVIEQAQNAPIVLSQLENRDIDVFKLAQEENVLEALEICLPYAKVGGTFLNICIVISCLGTLNGLMVAATRGMYSIAARNEGPSPRMFGQIDRASNMATNSAIWGLFVCALWLVYFYGANLTSGWFGLFNFDSSELPIVTIYAMYIPMFIMWMKKEKDLGVFKRFVLPSLSMVACIFMVFAAVYAHGITPYKAAAAEGRFSCPVLFYLIVFAVIMAIGMLLMNPSKKEKTKYQICLKLLVSMS